MGYPGAEVYLEPVAAGDTLPDMPLFLSLETYVLIPLEKTYNSAWMRVPAFLREILTKAKPPTNGKRKAGRRRRR